MCVQWDLRVHAKLTADIHSPAILVQPSVRLRVILWRNRSSHSVIQPIDLPYVYHSDGRVRKLGNAVTNHAMKEKYTAADVVSYDSNDHDLFVSSVGNERQISWSGCTLGWRARGRCYERCKRGLLSIRTCIHITRQAFMKSLIQQPSQSYAELLKSIR
jgi:hypothetical protein